MTDRQSSAPERRPRMAAAVAAMAALCALFFVIQLIGEANSTPRGVGAVVCAVLIAVLIDVVWREWDLRARRPRRSDAPRRVASVITSCCIVATTANDVRVTLAAAALGSLTMVLLGSSPLQARRPRP